MWTFIHENSILSWSSHCRSNTTTTRAILGNYASTLGQCPWRLYRSPSGGFSHTTSPTYASRTFGGACPPPSKNLLPLYQELGPSRHFPLAAGARSPQQLQTSITSTCGLSTWQITILSSYTFHIDVDKHLTCPIIFG